MRMASVKSAVVKRSVVITGHKTSVSLEDEFWKSLKEIARSSNMNLSDLISAIDSRREHANLSSAIRLFVLSFYRDQFLNAGGIHESRSAIQRLIDPSARMSSKVSSSG